MPNHVINKVKFTAPAATVEAFVQKHFIATEDGEKGFDFNTVIPIPSRLANIHTGCTTLPSGERVREWVTEDGVRKAVDSEALVKQYGASNWYDWAIQNWGTKWNAYSHYVPEQHSETEIEWSFETAWSCPEPVFEQLAAQYPDAKIVIRYADEDLGSNCGILIYKEGELVRSTEEGYTFACDLWGYDAEEEEDYDE